MTKAVIFDCDGTIVDSLGLANEVLSEYLGELGFQVTHAEAAARFGGGKLADSIAKFEADFDRNLPETFTTELRRRRDVAFQSRLMPLEGAEEVVRSLDVPRCVASNGPREQTELSLRVTGLLPHFEGRVFSAYDIGVWKPDPGLFLHVADALRLRPEDCLVVEDSLPGIEAGLAARMSVVAITSTEPPFRIPPGVRRIRRLAELADHVPFDPPRRGGSADLR